MLIYAYTSILMYDLFLDNETEAATDRFKIYTILG